MKNVVRILLNTGARGSSRDPHPSRRLHGEINMAEGPAGRMGGININALWPACALQKRRRTMLQGPFSGNFGKQQKVVGDTERIQTLIRYS